MAWQVDDNVWIERNSNGAAKLISHVLFPFTDPAIGHDPFALALAYLRVVKDELRIKNAELDGLARTLPSRRDEEPGQGSAAVGSRLRWQRQLVEIRAGTFIVTVQQTHDGAEVPVPTPGLLPVLLQIDVEGSGLRIVLHRLAREQPWRATGVTSTVRRNFTFIPTARVDRTPDVQLEVDGTKRSKAFLVIDAFNKVLRNFGFGTFEGKSRELRVKGDLLIHRNSAPAQNQRPLGGTQLQPPLEGADYAAVAFRIVPPPASGEEREARCTNENADMPPYELIARFPDWVPLQARALLTHALQPTPAGMVFAVDPITATGDFPLYPGAGNDRLNPHRTTVGLPHVLPIGPPWHLSGRFVRVEDTAVPGSIGYNPPRLPTPHFNFDVRTNEFAAVNAYYHLTTMLRRIEDDFGLPFETFAAGYRLPLRALHRAAITPGPCTDGNCVNAQVRLLPADPDPQEAGDAPHVQIRFALADLTRNPGSARRPLSPLGIACDIRIVWHEFCHALIGAATNEPELPFAHSAGDALAAINCDPGSRLALAPHAETYRGVTFPWAAYANRRHDRDVDEGWSWSGPLGTVEDYQRDVRDMSGYAREQVLSTTLFRLYRSLGGDAVGGGGPDLLRRTAAADYTTYLIVAAIRSLGLAVTVPAQDAGAFADALMQADVGVWALQTPPQLALAPTGRIGGTAHKVIRWAFEKQGYYKAPGADLAGAGNPPAIDVYLEDAAGRHGEYSYTADWTAAASAVWSRHAMDGGDAHQMPWANADNFLYVRVNNRGSSDAVDAQVSIRWAAETGAQTWPGPQWEVLAVAPGGAAQGAVPAGGEAVLGPFLWQPPADGLFSLLVAVDATGDLSNTHADSLIPCTLTAGPVEYLVPTDNNLGLSRWRVA